MSASSPASPRLTKERIAEMRQMLEHFLSFGVAPSDKVEQRQWWEARSKAESDAFTAFDDATLLRALCDLALSTFGPAPESDLSKWTCTHCGAVNRWYANKINECACGTWPSVRQMDARDYDKVPAQEPTR